MSYAEMDRTKIPYKELVNRYGFIHIEIANCKCEEDSYDLKAEAFDLLVELYRRLKLFDKPGASGPATDNDKCIEAWNREKAPKFHRVEQTDFIGTASYFYTSESASQAISAGFIHVCHITGALRLNAYLDDMTAAQVRQWGEMLVAAADFADQMEAGQ